MPTIHSTIEIAAAPAPLFRLSQDYGLRLEWDPFVRELRFLDGAMEPAVGVQVWVRAKNGLTMTVRYITVSPPDHIAMTMVQGPWMFRRFSGAWKFRALDGGKGTEVVFSYNFETRPGLLRWVMTPMARRVLQRDMDERLAALKRSVETGDILRRLGPG
jgi:ribosome-associated toxin RatA of RatAB toxin-antitoxin module